jgi:hypothetical protein
MITELLLSESVKTFARSMTVFEASVLTDTFAIAFATVGAESVPP